MPDRTAFATLVEAELVKVAPASLSLVKSLFSRLTSNFRADNPQPRMAAHYDAALGSGQHPAQADLDVLAEALISMRRTCLRAGLDLAGEKPRLAIIEDSVVNPAWAHGGGPAFWLAELQKHTQGISVELVPPDGIRPWHLAVLNPYGEAYSDTTNDALLPFITTYLEYGGVWIASGGVPFFYRRDGSDTGTSIQLDEGGAIIASLRVVDVLGYPVPIAMTQETPVPEWFNPDGNGGQVQAWRYLFDVPSSGFAMLSGGRAKDGKRCVLVSALRARRGYLVWCGLHMSGPAEALATTVFIDVLMRSLLPLGASRLLS